MKTSRRYGVPKTDIERVMTHYKVDEEMAKKMIEEKGIKNLLPERGTKMKEIKWIKTEQEKGKIETLDVNAYTWFDKINGNSYFAGEVIINYGKPDQRRYVMPFQYGYGEQYMQSAFELLKEKGEIPQDVEYPLWRYCKENNIILRNSIHEVPRKKDIYYYE